MPFSISDMTRKDETAEKIPTKGKGLGAFLSPSGFATIVLFPFTIWHSTRESKKSVKAMREARQEEAERIDAERLEEAKEDEKQRKLREKLDADRDGLGPQGPPREKKILEVDPIAPELEKHPENPRVCSPECPSYGMENCVVHHRRRSSRPTSPGLLAV
ncbi:hypothetical protein ACHAO9_000855 [Fusarium lateritium]